MIQRVQSIFLFLVVLAMIMVTFSSLWEQMNPDQTQKMKLTAWTVSTYSIENGNEGTVMDQKGVYYIGFLCIVAAFIALYSLFQFRNRLRQMFLNMINSLVMGITLGVAVYQSYHSNMEFNPSVSGEFLMGFYAIIVAIILNVISNRFIRKDEKLIRSVDRIR